MIAEHKIRLLEARINALNEVIQELDRRLTAVEMQPDDFVDFASDSSGSGQIAVYVRGNNVLEFDISNPPGLSFPSDDPSYYVAVNVIAETATLHTGTVPSGTDNETEYYQIIDADGNQRQFGDIHLSAF